MKGLKIIPVFLVLLLCTYVGILFVEANRDTVVVQFGNFQSHPAAMGLVVLTSILLGMILAGALCSIELMVLVVHNRKLRRRLGLLEKKLHAQGDKPSNAPPYSSEVAGSLEKGSESGDFAERQSANRFTPL